MTGGDNGAVVLGGHEVPAGSAVEEIAGELEPLVGVPPAARRSPAEEVRAILASTNTGTLATLTGDGDPWASVVTFGLLADASPVFCLSRLALHGRNVDADRRASLAVSEPVSSGRDPADSGRVTLAGVLEGPSGAELDPARAAYRGAVASAAVFVEFGDFTLWVLRTARVRWVGGFGRMASVNPEELPGAEPDPVAPHAAYAVAHLNADHSDALLLIARALAGHTDADRALCTRADRYGLDLEVWTPRGRTSARVGFLEPARRPDGLREATVELVRRARSQS